MSKTFEKMALGIFMIIVIGFNAWFIVGQQTEVTESQATSKTTSINLSSTSIDEAKARNIALTAAKGVVKEIEEKIVRGRAYYSVEIEDGETEVEVLIDRRNGDLIKVTREAKDDDEEVSAEELQTISGKLTEEEAKALALEIIRGGTVIGFETEREEGRLLYEVSLRAQGDTVEVEIDTRTGEVVEIEWGDD